MTHEPNCSKQFSNFYYRYAQGTGTGIGSSIFFANSSIIECQFCMDLRNKMCWEIKQQNKLDSRCNVQVKKTLILYVPVPVHTDCIIIITHSGYCIVQTFKKRTLLPRLPSVQNRYFGSLTGFSSSSSLVSSCSFFPCYFRSPPYYKMKINTQVSRQHLQAFVLELLYSS